MIVKGIEKVSLVDYDGYVACTVFTSGCNLRCPFCHNASCVCPTQDSPNVSEQYIFDYLQKRKGIIDAVCISGGEPTLQSDLIPFIRRVREMGLLVKLDTNGTSPDVLAHLIEQRLVDYIAMDVKNSLTHYEQTCGAKVNTTDIVNSMTLIKSSSIPYEFRVTLIKEYHSACSVSDMATMLAGADMLYLQHFVNSPNCIDASSLSPITEQDALVYKRCFEQYVKTVKLRGY